MEDRGLVPIQYWANGLKRSSQENNLWMVKTNRAVIHATISLNSLLNDEEMYLEGLKNSTLKQRYKGESYNEVLIQQQLLTRW